MVEAGLGVGIVPAMALDAKHHLVKGLALADVRLKRRIGLITPASGRLTPLAQRFVDNLRGGLVGARR
jgi:DNA-binding transcriptional LysR family regulator